MFTSDTSNTPQADCCSICLIPSDKKDELELDCSHIFHQHCIASWVDKVKEPCCPLCKRKIIPLDLDKMKKPYLSRSLDLNDLNSFSTLLDELKGEALAVRKLLEKEGCFLRSLNIVSKEEQEK